MNDTISRQAAIDAVAEGLKHTFVEYRDVAEKMLNKVPPAQPEIIHCKDCKYGEQDKDGWWYCGEFGCVFGDGEKGDGFCSDAEGREDAAD